MLRYGRNLKPRSSRIRSIFFADALQFSPFLYWANMQILTQIEEPEWAARWCHGILLQKQYGDVSTCSHLVHRRSYGRWRRRLNCNWTTTFQFHPKHSLVRNPKAIRQQVRAIVIIRDFHISIVGYIFVYNKKQTHYWNIRTSYISKKMNSLLVLF